MGERSCNLPDHEQILDSIMIYPWAVRVYIWKYELNKLQELHIDILLFAGFLLEVGADSYQETDIGPDSDTN
jgi:hypothetical protein